jgi:hypothetical protein
MIEGRGRERGEKGRKKGEGARGGRELHNILLWEG